VDIPPELAELRDTLPLLIQDMEQHVPYAAALVQRQEGHTITVDNREQQVEPADPRLGIVLSAWTGRRMVELATSELDPDRLRSMARDFVAGLSVEPDGLRVDPGEPLEREYATAVEVDPATVPSRAAWQRWILGWSMPGWRSRTRRKASSLSIAAAAWCSESRGRA